MKSKIIKGITLVLFASLIIFFVAYRSGYFEGWKITKSLSSNGSISNNQTDTIPKKDTIKRLEIMSSSKVIILREHYLQKNDSNKAEIDSSKKQ